MKNSDMIVKKEYDGLEIEIIELNDNDVILGSTIETGKDPWDWDWKPF